MSRGVIRVLGILLLLATIGVVSCQGLFAESRPVQSHSPAVAGQR